MGGLPAYLHRPRPSPRRRAKPPPMRSQAGRPAQLAQLAPASVGATKQPVAPKLPTAQEQRSRRPMRSYAGNPPNPPNPPQPQLVLPSSRSHPSSPPPKNTEVAVRCGVTLETRPTRPTRPSLSWCYQAAGRTKSRDLPLVSLPLDSLPLDSMSLVSLPLDSMSLDALPLDSLAFGWCGSKSYLWRDAGWFFYARRDYGGVHPPF